MSLIEKLASFNAFEMAMDGDVVNHSGSCEASAYPMIVASGCSLYLSTAPGHANRIAAGSSLILLSFAAVNGSIFNVTNDSLSLIKNKFSKVKLTSLLMSRGRLDIVMKFNLTDPGGAFEFSGKLGKLDAEMFNSAIRPLSLIEIKSGYINNSFIIIIK